MSDSKVICDVVFYKDKIQYLTKLCVVCRRNCEVYAENTAYFAQDEKKRFYDYDYLNARDNFASGRLAAKIAVSELEGIRRLSDIVIKNGWFNQPYILCDTSKADISITHCNRLAAALAFPKDILCGVDIENIKDTTSQTVKSILSEKESKLICDYSEYTGDELLTAMWCSKEACSKALKIGFSSGTKMFEISNIEVSEDKIEVCFDNLKNLKATVFPVYDYLVALAYPANLKMDLKIKEFIFCIEELISFRAKEERIF
jgi:phosphopantetheine--protein transferase-like protein